MGCSELKAPTNEGCASVQNNITESVTILRDSRACFDQYGNYIGIGDLDGNKLNLDRSMFSIKMSVREYCLVLGKSTSWATKHLRNGMILPYVIKAYKNHHYNCWELTVSPQIKLKQPLK